ncbi:ADP-ribosylation factor GTPase-activating protein AGD1 isoform X2 [Hevea brasiliensis]|uniref:ADP-ribosylation factor GTPase-activating protein AGD1 isoform X2 n=1 Tax=Hevea brasiliensis TaxID=3981 RepID=UPI0025E1C5A3|nr:ADP-ribosylation factor GTPase-activating protein AGD1 isoform X2 [Hevea brasiliensis]
MHFAKLDDSPMFRQQMQCMEESSELLRGRCLKFIKGCRKYTEGLGEGYDGDVAFASALETFGGGHNDPICVAFGGPVMNKFTIALRDIGTYKEVLRSQVEHILNDRLLQFVNVDLQDIKARDKFLSLRKSTRMDVANSVEEELYNARSSFEQARFHLVSSLSIVEAKKRFEFLEAVSGTMDAHIRYFKQGYELLHQLEPFINQVLAYAQQSRECSNYEQASLNERVQEYVRQIDRESKHNLNVGLGSPSGEGLRLFARSSQKVIEAVMQSAAKGKVQTIRQGYLSKRSSNLRGDWKRRFFVLDSQGMLYYYRKPFSWVSGTGSQSSVQRNVSTENGPGLLSRWLSSHYHGGVHDEKSVARHTVNLLTSTIKADADQSDLRFCFRIISPMKVYTLQAENALDQIDWIEKITGVITSLLSFQTPERHLSTSHMGDNHSVSDSSSLADCHDIDQTEIEEFTSNNMTTRSHLHSSKNSQQQECGVRSEKPIDVLRRVPGNDKCADCGAPEPDWASLNLGVLMCIECSGVHRNLGVHISKVRSLTLDVKVWEPSVLNLFQSLGNIYANSIWEELLHSGTSFTADEMSKGFSRSDRQKVFHIRKPSHDDSISVKEHFIHAKYAEKIFMRTIKDDKNLLSVAQQVWESVHANDKKAVYRQIVCSGVDVNAIHGQASFSTSSSLTFVIQYEEQENLDLKFDCFAGDSLDKPLASYVKPLNKTEDQVIKDFTDGCSLLHLACLNADMGMVELLLQYGANINASNSKGQTPLHQCIINRRPAIAKLLLMRGADPQAVDRVGNTAFQLLSQSALDDSELVVLLAK